jgi:hypothetical protein
LLVAAGVEVVVAAVVSAAAAASVVVVFAAPDLGLVWAIPITATADTIPIMVTRAFAMSSGDVS